MYKQSFQVGSRSNQILGKGFALLAVYFFHLFKVNLYQLLRGDSLFKALFAKLSVDSGLIQRNLSNLIAFLEQPGKIIADDLGALFVIGGNKGSISSGIGADIADDHRDFVLFGQRQYGGAGSTVYRRNNNGVNLFYNGILCVFQLGFSTVLGIVYLNLQSVFLCGVFNAGCYVTPERDIHGRGEICNFL